MPFALQPRRFHPFKTLFVAAIILGCLFWMIKRDAPAPDFLEWEGFTMGTTYSVKARNEGLGVKDYVQLKQDVDRLLEELNEQMSTYRPESEISQFNDSQSTAPIGISPEFHQVTVLALQLSHDSNGAFDPTLDPLINLWGFGDKGPNENLPSDKEISKTLASIGPDKLELHAPNRIQKTNPDIKINLNAIAKGYAVDEVSRLLNRNGLRNTFVEIGGEIFAQGLNQEGSPWTIGIQQPDPDILPGERLGATVSLQNQAVATSGNYRNFVRDEKGKVLSHILDPRTGHPVGHSLASVSVVAESCVLADGIATALFVMGAEEGLQWIEAYPRAEALFMVSELDGTFRQIRSSGFDR